MIRLWAAVFLTAALTIFLTTGCARQDPFYLEEFWGRDPAAVTAVSMRCGTSGELIEVEAEKDIEKLLEALGRIEATRSSDQRLRTGYLYYLDIFVGEGEPVRLTFMGDMINHEGSYYDLKSPLDPNLLDEFFTR